MFHPGVIKPVDGVTQCSIADTSNVGECLIEEQKNKLSSRLRLRYNSVCFKNQWFTIIR